MKNKTALFPLLLVCPLLFMANSPAPYTDTEEYNDYTITNLTYGEQDEDHKYPLRLTINNTGSDYMPIGYEIEACTKDNDYFYLLNEQVSYRTYIYYARTCIAPNTSMELVASDPLSRQYELSDLRIDARCYKVTSEASYSSISLVGKDSVEYDNTCFYNFVINDFKFDDNYYNAMIVDMNIKENRIAFQFSEADDEFGLALVDDTLTEADFTINSVQLIQGRSKFVERINDTWTIVYVCLGVTFFIGFLVSLGFIPLIVKASTKRAKKEDVTNN